MTDNQIIKVLKCCKEGRCSSCHYDGIADTSSECLEKLVKDVFDLVNRQKAEIESLSEQERILICQLAEEREKAIKEFALRLKKSSFPCDVSFGYGREHFTEAVAVLEIDNLAEEMTK